MPPICLIADAREKRAVAFTATMLLLINLASLFTSVSIVTFNMHGLRMWLRWGGRVCQPQQITRILRVSE